MEDVKFVGGWYLEDQELEITPKRVMKMIQVTSDPRSDFYDMVRKEAVPADELMGRRTKTGRLVVLAQLRAKANWHRIMREWVDVIRPATVLGGLSRRYFERRGRARRPGMPSRVGGLARPARLWVPLVLLGRALLVLLRLLSGALLAPSSRGGLDPGGSPSTIFSASGEQRRVVGKTPCTPIPQELDHAVELSTVQVISSTPAFSAASTSFGVTIWW